ncbi:MAG: RNA polymerase sigma factor region1.1 domain-containing protein, partial [Acutalibacteraceae bacterium]
MASKKSDVQSPVQEVLREAAAAEMQELEMVSVKKDKKLQLRDIVELGRAKGKLTTQEIMDAMEDFDFDPEQVDKLYEMLEAN